MIIKDWFGEAYFFQGSSFQTLIWSDEFYEFISINYLKNFFARLKRKIRTSNEINQALLKKVYSSKPMKTSNTNNLKVISEETPTSSTHKMFKKNTKTYFGKVAVKYKANPKNLRGFLQIKWQSK